MVEKTRKILQQSERLLRKAGRRHNFLTRLLTDCVDAPLGLPCGNLTGTRTQNNLLHQCLKYLDIVEICLALLASLLRKKNDIETYFLTLLLRLLWSPFSLLLKRKLQTQGVRTNWGFRGQRKFRFILFILNTFAALKVLDCLWNAC